MKIQQFKKKPIIIKAVQYLDNSGEIVGWINQNNGYSCINPFGEVVIQTLEGEMTVSKNDWVIQGINGEFYPCKPDIFEKTYEETS